MRASVGTSRWAVPSCIFLILTAAIQARAELPESSAPDTGSGAYQSFADRGWKALMGRSPDSSIDHFMEAYRRGMSKDSLFFFLAEAAIGRASLDTAMVFNLSIPSPQPGAFREAVLGQRYRLFVRSGLTRDAAELSDSLKIRPDSPLRTARELDLSFSAGYFREEEYPAVHYPFGEDLGAFRLDGMQYLTRARLKLPVVSRGPVPISAGLEYEVLKSYAKDSLDYRVGFSLREENLFLDSLGLAVTVEIGKVTGAGTVTACKLESSFLSFSASGITMLQGGLESEWSDSWANRFVGAWISYYRDRSLATGRGYNYSFSIAAIKSDIIAQPGTQPILYVDDVSKPEPVHYSDSTFTTVVPNSRISGFTVYVSNAGGHETQVLTSQTVVTALPNLGYGFPLAPGLSAEVNGQYAVSVYPEAYVWREAPLAPGVEPVAGDFRGLALNQADGRIYSAQLVHRNGGFEEYYGPAPMETVSRIRVDQQAGLDIGLRYRMQVAGVFVLNGFAKRNMSNLADAGPTWIPENNLGAVFKWSRNWKW